MMQETRPGLSQPQPVPRTNPSRHWPRIALFLALVALLVSSFTVPIPIVYREMPGPVRDVERLVEVHGPQTYSSEGRLLLTSVSFDTQVTLVELVLANFDPTTTVVTRDQITEGMSFEELKRIQVQEMENAQSAAEVVAATALGDPGPTGDGALVSDVIREPATGDLEPGDRIVAIDDREVTTICDVHGALADAHPGDPIEITVLRDGTTESPTLRVTQSPIDPQRAFLGIVMSADYDFDPSFDAEFDTGPVAGPSGGLMLALGLYDQLTPEDLTRGRAIAGTGTITCDGSVGPIGGIERKIVAAQAAGADAFLAPAGNASAARAVAGDLEIVPVESFDDALRYLEGH